MQIIKHKARPVWALHHSNIALSSKNSPRALEFTFTLWYMAFDIDWTLKVNNYLWHMWLSTQGEGRSGADKRWVFQIPLQERRLQTRPDHQRGHQRRLRPLHRQNQWRRVYGRAAGAGWASGTQSTVRAAFVSNEHPQVHILIPDRQRRGLAAPGMLSIFGI